VTSLRRATSGRMPTGLGLTPAWSLSWQQVKESTRHICKGPACGITGTSGGSSAIKGFLLL
jgi:hypothetical protein